ncbi:Roundabout 2 [Amphibalanus amphitrite]|uniref:Roundabout 2 n=1 Tax=Amphibalanus amphitrite TaxID=1232801 RepID=A0A6A4WA28_AMPAM|nr:Roundabout 2 [Amphibalanus amphitrite]
MGYNGTYVIQGTGYTNASSPSGDRPPRITEHPSDTTVARGSPAMLNCKADGSPAPAIHWERDGRPVEAPSPTWVALPSGSLFVLAVARTDAGRYRCVAVNRAGEAASREAVLTAAVLREEFRVSPQDTEASVGSRVTLRCSPPKGDPPPTVGWIKDYSQVDFNAPNSRFSLAGEGDLVIPNVTLSDTGTYCCVAKNYAGMKRRSRPAQLAVSESDEKRRDGVSLLPSSVRPASWMEGSVWSAELTGRRTESDRNPPTGTGGRGRGLVDSVPSPTPYATTALLQTGSDDSWMDSCRKSRDISTSSFGVFSTRGSGRSSDCSARYSRPHIVTSQNGDVIRVTAPRPGVEDDTAEVMACGVFPFECQPGTGQTDPLWRVGEHQGVPRDAYQPLLGDPSRRGGERCAAGSHQGRLSFIGEGPVSADRRDIYREEGSSFYGPSSAGGPSQDNKRASARY